MSSKSEPPVVLTSYSIKKEDSIDAYFHECQSFHQHAGSSGSETDDEVLESDKDEQGIYTNSEAIWLEKLGFGNYVSQLETGDGSEGAEETLLTNAGLSKHHAHAIRRRMNTLRSTVRSRRNKESTEEDVPESGSQLLHSPAHSGAKLGSPHASPTSTRRGHNLRILSDRLDRRNRRGDKSNDRNMDSGVYSANSSRDGTPTRGQHTGDGPLSGPLSEPADVTPTTRTGTPIRGQHAGNGQHTGERPRARPADMTPITRTGTPIRGQHAGNGQHTGERPRARPADMTPITRTGTPIRGQHTGDGTLSGPAEVTPTTRTRVLGSPRHQFRDQSTGVVSEQNGLHRTKRLNEMGEGGTYLDRGMQRGKIDPVALNLVSKMVDNSPDEQPSSNGTDLASDSDWSRRRAVKRSSSDRLLSPPSSSSKPAIVEVEVWDSKSLPRGGNEIHRSPSPLQGPADSAMSDIKLLFGSPAHSGSVSNGGPVPSDLPNFMISPDALGITRIQDLSQEDMEKVRGVALLELTVTFDDHDITLRSRRPAKAKNYPENALRGVPLSMLLQCDLKREPSASVPLILEEMISHLETHALEKEGLLRIPGSAARVNALLQRLEDTFHCGTFSFSGVNCNDVCSLLKQFIRELPIPLLTREYLPAFASITDISGLKEQLRTLNLLVLLLPDLHQKVLKRLLELCEKIILHSTANKMDLTNVAMVIAPNLFIKLPSRQSMDDVAMATKTSQVVRLLIKYHKLLWTIPGEMLRQIRYLYENEVHRLNPRSVQKAIKQMHNEMMDQLPSRGITTPKVSHHIIRVKAPLFTRVCMAVDICVGVTAGDIITKLQKKSRLNQDLIRKRFSSSNLTSSGLHSPVSITQSLIVHSPVSSSGCHSPVSITSSFSGLRSSGDSPVEENANRLKLPEEVMNAGQQFLYEVGGNIGERCLPNNTDMYSLFSVNPHAQWIIKPRNCPDLNS